MWLAIEDNIGFKMGCLATLIRIVSDLVVRVQTGYKSPKKLVVLMRYSFAFVWILLVI